MHRGSNYWTLFRKELSASTVPPRSSIPAAAISSARTPPGGFGSRSRERSLTRGGSSGCRSTVVDKISQIHRFRRLLTMDLGHAPSLGELASAVDADPGAVQAILELFSRPTSLDMPVGDGSGTVGDFVPASDVSVEDTVLQRDEAEGVHELIRGLDERSARIIRLRFGVGGGKPKTLEEIGKEFGLTRERIRQIEANALSALRGRAATLQREAEVMEHRVSSSQIRGELPRSRRDPAVAPFVEPEAPSLGDDHPELDGGQQMLDLSQAELTQDGAEPEVPSSGDDPS